MSTLKLRVTVMGKRVHEVGYRLFLLEKADELSINRMEVSNRIQDGKEIVLILIDDEPEKVEEFISKIRRESPEPSSIEDVVVEEYQGEVMEIEKFRAILNTIQLSKIVQGGLQIIEELKGVREEVRETKEELKGVREEVRETKETTLSGIYSLRSEIRETRENIVEELRETRGSIREILSGEISELKREISEIREALRREGII